MRLRAQIVIDIDAEDFADAAVHQKKVEQAFAVVRQAYGQAQLEFRHRRERPHRQTRVGSSGLHYTGRMNEYEE